MSTYIPLQSITLTSTATTITFSGIPQNYTDLILVTGDILNPTNLANMYFQFNDDTGSNYSRTWFEGTGSSSASSRDSNQTSMKVGRSYGGNRTINIFHFQNYSNVTTNKTVIGRSGSGDTSSSTVLSVGLWRSNAAINKIVIGIEGGIVFSSGCTFTLYGIAAGTAKAIGGEVTVSGGFAYHTFRQSGVFTPLENLTVDYLVVAGGGGTITTANQYYAGGGGGGGLRSSVSPTGGGGSAEAQFSAVANTDYSVVIGAGAPAMPSGRFGIQGNTSSFATISCTGGGYGTTGPGQTSAAGGAGGSGGGAGSNNGAPFTIYGGGSNVAGQGYPGGQNEASDAYAAGGGGGAASAGGNAGAGGAGKGGTGGAAVLNSISGTATYYAGGGWGGRGFYGAATKGDDGTGYNQNPNTGMGGNATTAAGQSGIVIVRYAI
jgi:hypothetical protein